MHPSPHPPVGVEISGVRSISQKKKGEGGLMNEKERAEGERATAVAAAAEEKRTRRKKRTKKKSG